MQWTQKEPAGSSKSPEVSTSPTGSTISISNLLDYVNNYFPDILPESVLKHYGYSSRLEGNVGKGALFSRDVNIDSRHNYFNALSKAEFRQFYSIPRLSLLMKVWLIILNWFVIMETVKAQLLRQYRDC